MKLVFLIDNKKFVGGGKYSIYKFAEYLAKIGHEIYVFGGAKAIFYQNYDLPKNMKIIYRPHLKKTFKGTSLIDSKIKSINTKLNILPKIKKINPDYIIGLLREEAIDSVTIAKKLGIKSVIFFFENPLWIEEKFGKKEVENFNKKLKNSWEKTKNSYLQADIKIGNSKLSEKYYEKWLHQKSDGYVYPAIDFTKYNNINKKNQIISIGRLDKNKNTIEIILALSKIKNPPELIIIGGGSEKEKIDNLACELDVNVKFLGNVSDEIKFNEINKSLFMVFPSSFEGFGMPPLEALYFGIPCICSNLKIFREVYKNKVEYFKEHNVNDLTKKIKFLMSNPNYCLKKGKDGKKYVLNNFSWEKSANKIEKILLNAVKNYHET
jgi:glycosyltransferase involved in cell wall biosynthesis